MARLVCITNGLSGGLNATLELARRLGNAGHELHLVGHRDLDELMEAHELSYHQLTADDDALSQLQDAIESAGRLRSLPQALQLRRQFVSAEELAGVVSSLEPDALIIDVEAHYAVLATRPLGVPTLLKSDWFSMSRRWGIPPLHSDLPLPRTFREKRVADLVWARALAERLVENTIGQLHPTRLMRRMVPFRYDTISRHDLKAVAKSRGLSLRSLTSQTNWLRPHTYRSLPMITSTAAELDFGVESDANVHSIGPLIRRDRIDTVVTPQARAEWTEFRNRNAAAERPLLYCSFGTILAESDVLVDKIISVVARRPEWDLVVGRGRLNSSAEHEQPSIPGNILVLDYAPQAQVLASADLAITHGGINTINECAVLGVPMLVYAAGSTDQPGGAARIQQHRIGSRARFDELGEADIAKLIEQSLGDQQLKSRVSQMQATVLRYEHDGIAEQLVERLLKGAL